MKVKCIIRPNELHREGRPAVDLNNCPKVGDSCFVLDSFLFGGREYYQLVGYNDVAFSANCFKILDMTSDSVFEAATAIVKDHAKKNYGINL